MTILKAIDRDTGNSKVRLTSALCLNSSPFWEGMADILVVTFCMVKQHLDSTRTSKETCKVLDSDLRLAWLGSNDSFGFEAFTTSEVAGLRAADDDWRTISSLTLCFDILQ